MLIRDHCHERNGRKGRTVQRKKSNCDAARQSFSQSKLSNASQNHPVLNQNGGHFCASPIQSLKWVAQRTWSQPGSSEGVDSWRLSPDHTPCSWAVSHKVLPPSWHRIFPCSFRLASSGWESMWYDRYNSIALFLLSYLLCCKVSPPSNIMWDSMLVDHKSSDSECWLRPSGR